MRNERYHAIVVGAGPAGAAAALTMAKNNLSVLLLERGKYPGSKNMYGGTIYALPTAQTVPAFWETAPLERKVVSEELLFLDTDSAVKVGFTGLRFAKPPYSKFTALRSKFDTWLANQAVQAGATLRTEATAIDLLWDSIGFRKQKIDGVRLDSGEEIRADLVIIAEGVLGFLTQKAGLRKPAMAHDYTFYTQEVYGLPREKIESRFNLEKDEGASVGFLGFPTGGANGKGGIWTNLETITVITGGNLNEFVTKGLSPYHLLSRLKEHPIVKRFLKGAELLEYKAHMIPKGGYEKLPTLSNDGVIVCGDAALMVSGRRGTDLAMLSGQEAGETAAQAHAKNDYSKNILRTYDHKLNQSFYLQDIRKSKGSKQYDEHHSDSDYLVSKLANELAYKFFDVELKTKKEIEDDLKQTISSLQPLDKTLKDLYHGFYNWRVF